MKTGTFVRTFQDLEEKHIERFIRTHAPFSDTIYIGTCQTSEQTIAQAKRWGNRVKFREFDVLIHLADGTPLAHESVYYHALHQWSLEENLDFVFFDDADHAPNRNLRLDTRALIEEHDPIFAYALLMYFWRTDQYFPELNNCNPSERLWGWNPRKWQPDISQDHAFTIEVRNQPDRDITQGYVFPHPPYAIGHFSWITEGDAYRKMAFNKKRGVNQTYPPDSCGRLEPIPHWARV